MISRNQNHLDGLPLGTRGGTLIEHTFPLDAEYSFRIRVRGAAIGLAAANLQGEEIEVSLDGERIKLVPATATIDVRLPMKAGPHALGVTFVRKPPPGADDVWQIFAANSGVQSVAITGPLAPTALGDTPSRRRIFVCHPQSPADEALASAKASAGSRRSSLESDASEGGCAKRILSAVARRAFRQPVTDADIQTLIEFFETGQKDGGFDAGIEDGARARAGRSASSSSASSASRRTPPTASRIAVSDIELASRLSFFLWSSIPDDELLDVAVKGKLHEPAVLEQQTRRMLADPQVARAGHQLRRPVAVPARAEERADPTTRPDFDDNLRQAFRRETEMLFESIIREDRSVLDLLDADYTFVERAAGAGTTAFPNVRRQPISAASP